MVNGVPTMDEILEMAEYYSEHPTPEMIAYQNEKKNVYYLQFSNGYRVYNGVDFVRLAFKEEVARKDFHNILSEAEASDNRYQDLLNAEFQSKYGIESIEVIEIEERIILKEKIKYVNYNPETGEEVEVDREGNPI